MGIIYKIANDINKKIYVGQTTQKLKDRINKHKNSFKYKKEKNKPLPRAIKKYGWKHFKVEILEDNIPLENLNERELYWTNFYNALSPNGYVLIAGGTPRIISKETRKKLSITFKKLWNNKNYKKKMSGKNNHKSIKILCYDLNDNFIKEYDCIRDASRELNLDHSTISRMCSGKRKINRVKNYKFKYK